ncbi:MAG: heme-binding domain-containing protein [Sulfurimonas sp.]|uniref:heme-binding domain-containing protein n=1 Tax=Sulfurimonas sp. TaxID=2022749 RepID=UPI003D0AA514
MQAINSLIFKLSAASLFSAVLLLPIMSFAHEDNSANALKKEVHVDKNLPLYETINSSYLANIKPILEKKCFDCHSDSTKFPWYYKIPGFKQMIDYDIKKAKRHINMSKDFPFISHNTPLKDLESLREVVIKNEMPPLRYVIAHWDARLTKSEREAIIKWSEESISKLREFRYQ